MTIKKTSLFVLAAAGLLSLGAISPAAAAENVVSPPNARPELQRTAERARTPVVFADMNARTKVSIEDVRYGRRYYGAYRYGYRPYYAYRPYYYTYRPYYAYRPYVYPTYPYGNYSYYSYPYPAYPVYRPYYSYYPGGAYYW